jgi:hypothetical protein
LTVTVPAARLRGTGAAFPRWPRSGLPGVATATPLAHRYPAPQPEVGESRPGNPRLPHTPISTGRQVALWGQRQKIRRLRADSGFFEGQLLSFLEQRQLPYIVVARLTKWVKRAAQRVEQWRDVDENFAVGEFRLQLHGWKVERRFVAIRERVREGRDSVGRKLIDVPGYTFRFFFTVAPRLPRRSGATTTGAPTWKTGSWSISLRVGADCNHESPCWTAS